MDNPANSRAEQHGDPLLYRVEDGIAYLTLNRPRHLNAIGKHLAGALNAAFAAFREDEKTRVMVMDAAGDRAFSAGFDIKEGDRAFAETGAEAGKAYELDFLRADLNGKPVIAAIQGHCVGLGVALALAADIRIGATDAEFSVTEARIGISAVQLPSLLVERIGYAHSGYFLLHMGPLDAKWALRSGMLHEVTDPRNLRDRAVKIAQMLASQAPLALRAHKKLLLAANPSCSDDAIELAVNERKRTLNSEDFPEGRKAFIEKRDPHFRGR